MSHKYEAGGERSHQFTLEYRLPHDCHMSPAGYAVLSPPPDGPELRSLIEEGRA
jgi:hypothetical protein